LFGKNGNLVINLLIKKKPNNHGHLKNDQGLLFKNKRKRRTHASQKHRVAVILPKAMMVRATR
jgi:hypothetical protein